MGPEEQKFKDWLEKEKQNGLVDLKVSLAEGVYFSDRETICKSLNTINDNISSGKAKKLTKEMLGELDTNKYEKYTLEEFYSEMNHLNKCLEDGNFTDIPNNF